MIRSLFRFLLSTFFWICAILGFLIVALGLSLYFGTGGFYKSVPKPLKQDSVLSLTLNGTYVEHTEADGIKALLLGSDASLYNLTRAILYAADDPKIKGLTVRLESPGLGTAQIQELRDALMAFRKSGKPSWCYTDSFGELSSGTGLYYLASACGEIWLQPLGTVNLTGLNIEVPFGKGALDKLDIKPEMVQRKEYKSFVEMFTREDFSEPNREVLQAIVDSILSQVVDGIAEGRGLSHDQVRHLIDNGPYLIEEAQKEKLIDRIDYRQALIPAVQEKLGQGIKFVKLKTYLETLPTDVKGGKVALMFGSGIIQRDGKAGPLEELTITANETYKAFHHIFEDPDVKVVVFRINSEGGSPAASETIYSLIQNAKARGIPVIISMSDAAASGGYWISVAGSKLVAQPATLTGSIGVFGGKFVLSGLFEKLGVKWGNIETSENGTMWSVNRSFTPSQWIKINGMMDQIYNAFTYRVAKGRHMTPQEVEKVARGRVWTGEQALALGLVDQLGGLSTAIELAKEVAGLPSTAGVQIFPPEKTFVESLAALFDEEEDEVIEVGILGAFLRPLKKIVAVFTFILSSQDQLYTPLGKVK